MYIKYKETQKLVPIDSDLGKEAEAYHRDKTMKRLELEKIARDKVIYEKQALGLAEAEATLRETVEDAGLTLEEFLSLTVKPKRSRRS